MMKTLKMLKVKDIVLTFLVVVFLILSVFCLSFSVSAEEVQDNTTVVEVVEDKTIDNGLDLNDENVTEPVVEENTASNESLSNIEFYLQYIFGFLLFFVVCFLFWCSYKFLNIFF